jgi:hypothetical protein
MEVRIFRRHSADCPDKADRYASPGVAVPCGASSTGLSPKPLSMGRGSAGAEQVDSRDPKWLHVLKNGGPA